MGGVAIIGAGALLARVEWTAPSGAPVAVSLVQGNVAQDVKFDRDVREDTFQLFADLVTASRGRLIVLPESAYPMFAAEVPDRVFLQLARTAAARDGDVLAGMFTADPPLPGRDDIRYYNSVVSVGQADVQLYRKRHLVPFGETIPLEPVVGWFIRAVLAIPLADQASGEPGQPPFAVAGQRVAVNICYEDAFGNELRPQARDATLLVNVTNDAWYGRSLAAEQHNQIGAMRALESGRPLLRATNTGITSAIDHHGREFARLPWFTRGILEVEVAGRQGTTPYVRWGDALPLAVGGSAPRDRVDWPLPQLAGVAGKMTSEQSNRRRGGPLPPPMHTFQQIITRLQDYWGRQGCALLQPYDMEVGAGTSHTATFLRAIGPEPWRAAYVQPSRRPKDGRYGENPNRMQHYYQYQVVLKPSPTDILDLYLGSLDALGFDLKKNDVRFVEDDWENPTLGAWGLGWEVWLNGMEVTQFTYFQQVGGLDCNPITGEITYGLERLAMYLQGKENVFDLVWTEWEERGATRQLTYRDVYHQNEVEQSTYNFEQSNAPEMFELFTFFESEAKRLLEAKLALPGYEMILKAAHTFNLLDARGAISVTERAAYIGRIRTLSRMVAQAYYDSREALGFPMLASGRKRAGRMQ